MNSKDVKRVMSELVSLINTVNYIPWMEGDLGFRFISSDDRFRVEFEEDEFHYEVQYFNQATLEWEPDEDTPTLEELDEEGVSWQFTDDLLDRFEETILEVRDHINAHESDIALFERTINHIAGETILSCL